MPSGMENNFLERTANESLSEKERTTWVAVKRKGVLPKISSYAEYTAAISKGMSKASDTLVRIGYNGIPTAKLAQLTHHRIFSEVTPWAGQFSKLTLNSGGFISADPGKMAPEYDLLAHQSATLAASADSDEKWAHMLAFNVARQMRIHAFADGNKRTTSIMTLAGATHRWGDSMIFREHVLPSQVFENCIKEAKKGNLRPMAETLLHSYGRTWSTEYDFALPYKIHPNYEAVDMELSEPIHQSIKMR
jgi:fido (protein-threonine AMPylation protein)